MAERDLIDRTAEKILEHCKELGCVYARRNSESAELYCGRKLFPDVVADRIMGGCNEIEVEFQGNPNLYIRGRVGWLNGEFIPTGEIPKVIEP